MEKTYEEKVLELEKIAKAARNAANKQKRQLKALQKEQEKAKKEGERLRAQIAKNNKRLWQLRLENGKTSKDIAIDGILTIIQN